MNPRIIRVIQGVHMGLSHDGLEKLLKSEAKINVAELASGELVMCLNRYGDKMKVVGHKGLVIGYLRLPNKERIALGALQYLPETFGGGGFNYQSAAKKALLKSLARDSHG